MTKKQWSCLLEDLNRFRSGRLFRAGIFYIKSIEPGSARYYYIESINMNNDGFIKFDFGDYLRFKDVKNIAASAVRHKFQLTMCPFDILKTRFSKGDIL